MKELQTKKLISNIGNFYYLFRKEFLDLMPDNNSELSPVLFRMLNEINFEGTITSCALSKKVSVSIPNTSRNINKLVDLGYVIKKQDKIDRRITHLVLSQKGLELISNSFATTDEILNKKFAFLNPSEIEQLSDAFATITELFVKISNVNDDAKK